MQAGRSGSRRLQTTVLLPVSVPANPRRAVRAPDFCIPASLAGVITPPNSENRKAYPAGQYTGSQNPGAALTEIGSALLPALPQPSPS